MAHSLSNPLLIASITGSSILTGCLFSLSYVSVAAICSTPTTPEVIQLTQWRAIFRRGFHLCPPTAIFSGLCCFINGFLTYRNGGSSGAYPLLTAGLCMIGIVPYTLTLIVPLEEFLLNKQARLVKAAEELGHRGVGEKKESVEETRRLLKRWAGLNYGRTILPLLGLVIAWSIW